jgi:DNA-directed RNA polymerase subunit F
MFGKALLKNRRIREEKIRRNSRRNFIAVKIAEIEPRAVTCIKGIYELVDAALAAIKRILFH